MPIRPQYPGFHSFLSFYTAAGAPVPVRTRGLSALASTSAHASRSNCVLPCSHASATKRLFHASARAAAAAKDPYQVLGVAKDAAAADIKKVYFSLARKYHPDTNPDKGARERFQEIQEAYDTLKDDKKRAAYDKFGSASQQPGFDADAFEQMRSNPFAGGFGGFGGGSAGGFRTGSPEDLFSNLFGGSFGGAFGGRPQSMRGDDLEASVNITFADACKGTSRTLNTTPVTDCHTCSGSGLKAGAKRTTCGTCRGTGTQRYVVEGNFQVQSTCTTCNGTGSTVPRGSSCGTCDGVGKLRQRQTVNVDIPPGAEDGMIFRMPGKGDAPISGKGRSGDLLIRINVASSKVFRRQGPNLYHDARIPMHTAVLGGRVRIPTLDGDVEVRVPSGTQQGEEMVLKKRGIASRVSGYVDQGDLFVSFRVLLPRSLTDRQRALMQQYADDVEGRTASTSSGPTPSAKADQGTDTPKTTTKDNDTSAAPDDRSSKDNDDQELDGKTKARATA